MDDQVQITVFGIPIDEVEGLVDKVKDYETTIEGLAQANLDLEGEANHHRYRYNRALALVEGKEHKIQQLQSHIQAITKSLTEVSGAFLKMVQGVQALSEAIGSLRDVPEGHYDDAVDAVQAQAYKLLSDD